MNSLLSWLCCCHQRDIQDEAVESLLNGTCEAGDGTTGNFGITLTENEQKQCRRMVAQGRVPSMEKAKIATILLKMGYEENQTYILARNYETVEEAVAYMSSLKECKICTDAYEVDEMITMLHCTHQCCTACAKRYFINCIRESSLRELVCPFCREPKLLDDEYLSNISLFLHNLLDRDVCEILEKKMLDLALDADSNIRHCPKCECIYYTDPDDRRLCCLKCNTAFCNQCKVEWEDQHDGVSCEEFSEWKAYNDPEYQASHLYSYLEANGIDCPQCRSRFALSKGGCMHFKCPKCKYEFCSECRKPFKQGKECNVSKNCKSMGIHAHHPRNCLFYLRDFDIKDLQSILRKNKVRFQSSRGKAVKSSAAKVCQEMLQKETEKGLKDDICGEPRVDGSTGLCRLHYIEYLVNLIVKNKLDPVVVMEVRDLALELERNKLKTPVKFPHENDDQYKTRLRKVVIEAIPLEELV